MGLKEKSFEMLVISLPLWWTPALGEHSIFGSTTFKHNDN
jgi:hypothetical protein